MPTFICLDNVIHSLSQFDCLCSNCDTAFFLLFCLRCNSSVILSFLKTLKVKSCIVYQSAKWLHSNEHPLIDEIKYPSWRKNTETSQNRSYYAISVFVPKGPSTLPVWPHTALLLFSVDIHSRRMTSAPSSITMATASITSCHGNRGDCLSAYKPPRSQRLENKGGFSRIFMDGRFASELSGEVPLSSL